MLTRTRNILTLRMGMGLAFILMKTSSKSWVYLHLTKLGPLSLKAKAIVERTSESVDLDRDGGRDVTMCAQITDMAIEKGEVVKDAAAILYLDMDK